MFSDFWEGARKIYECMDCHEKFRENELYGMQCQKCYEKQCADKPTEQRLRDLEVAVRRLHMSMSSHSHASNTTFG